LSYSGVLGSSRRTGRCRVVRPRRARYQLAAVASVAALLVAGCSSADGSDAGKQREADHAHHQRGLLRAGRRPADVRGRRRAFTPSRASTSSSSRRPATPSSPPSLGGSVQFASTSTLNVLKAAGNGAKFVNFMPIEIGYSEDVIMSKDAYAAAGLTANSTVKEKIAALAGKKLGVISATGENAIIFKYLFNYAGIPTSNLRWSSSACHRRSWPR